ncbi:MAG: hypothetical protein WC781_04515 [Candidatus Pacearchaeota archaeon]|jgi:hypothetical protein
MAKRKAKKSAGSKKVEVKRSSMNTAAWFFVKLLIVVLFVYGLYSIWQKDWTWGLSIIAFDLLVIFGIKLYYRLKRK